MSGDNPGAETVGAWLEDLASGAATPGGGAAAAIAGACGAALVAMTGRLTIGRKGFEDAANAVEAIVARADRVRSRFLELAEEDAAGFGAVMAAFKLPKESERERAARKLAIQDGYARATGPPMEIARLSVEVLSMAEEMARVGNPAAASDAYSAAAMLAAASIAAAANVRINASALEDAELASSLERGSEDLRERAEAALARTRGTFLARIGDRA